MIQAHLTQPFLQISRYWWLQSLKLHLAYSWVSQVFIWLSLLHLCDWDRLANSCRFLQFWNIFKFPFSISLLFSSLEVRNELVWLCASTLVVRILEAVDVFWVVWHQDTFVKYLCATLLWVEVSVLTCLVCSCVATNFLICLVNDLNSTTALKHWR